MFKVWGGGIYELEEFYEIADELGILIWQVNCTNMIRGSRSWQPFGETKNNLKIYVRRVFAIFATNASFLRIIANLHIYFSIIYAMYHM